MDKALFSSANYVWFSTLRGPFHPNTALNIMTIKELEKAKTYKDPPAKREVSI